MNAIHVYPPIDGDGTRALIEARDEQRRLRDGTTLVDPVDILIYAGTYLVQSPIELTTLDFGSIRAPITWRPAGDGPVILRGAYDLDVVQDDDDGVLSCQVQPETQVHGMFDGNEWLRTARYPNVRPGEPWFGGWLVADEPPPERSEIAGDSGAVTKD